MNFFVKLKNFLVELKNENKIPKRDKTLIVIFLLLSFLPPIFISEWDNSLYGFLFSFFLFSFVPDYFFNILDQNIILSHYPFDMKSFNAVKRFGQFLASVTPTFISDFIWEYQKEVM